jgi:5-methyltetrahydropteroyltriglutamate--homocysteine methyltransferase
MKFGGCVALQAIDGLDADVLTIENSRSGDEMLRALAKYGYSRDIGAGVYDVHSPVVPPCAPCHFSFTPVPC